MLAVQLGVTGNKPLGRIVGAADPPQTNRLSASQLQKFMLPRRFRSSSLALPAVRVGLPPDNS
jgi:hypothetical protein